MRNKLKHRTLLMATLVMAVIGASSLPATATPVATHFDFTDSNGWAAGGTPGSITIDGTTVDIAGSGAGACGTADAHSFLTPTIDDGSAGGNAGAVSLLTTDYKHAVGTTVYSGLASGTFNISGTDYKVQLFGHHNTTGDVDPNPASVDIDVQVVFSPCAGGTALCTVNHIVATLTGTYSGSFPSSPVHGDMLSVSGSAPALAASNFAVGCNATIRAALLGDVASVNLYLINNLSALPH